jgi:hypothetical protein
MTNSYNFAKGLEICFKYFTDETKIAVIEVSSISIFPLTYMTDSDYQNLKDLNWNCGWNNVEGVSFAEYFHLEYLDT